MVLDIPWRPMSRLADPHDVLLFAFCTSAMDKSNDGVLRKNPKITALSYSHLRAKLLQGMRLSKDRCSRCYETLLMHVDILLF